MTAKQIFTSQRIPEHGKVQFRATIMGMQRIHAYKSSEKRKQSAIKLFTKWAQS